MPEESPAESVDPRERRHNAPLERAFYTIRQPVEEFIRYRASSGIVLLAATLLALVAVNSQLAPVYYQFINTNISLHVGGWELEEPLHLWVSDGLMGIFFLAVGLEIKREVMMGELSTPRKAALPILAAVGGVIVPAVIYMGFMEYRFDLPESRGWAVPVATDIAFSIGVLALLGERVPRAFYMFLITLAIVDDLMAVAIIAVFYTDHIVMLYVWRAAGVFCLLLLLNMIGVRRLLPYLLVGAVLWFWMLKSGIHATMAGVLIAMTIPAKPKVHPRFFGERVRHIADKAVALTTRYEDDLDKRVEISPDFERQAVLHYVNRGIYFLEVPLHRMQDLLRIPVAFLIMPVFAFVNAGVPLAEGLAAGLFANPVESGVWSGLVFGKPLGITLITFVALKAGIASLPKGVHFRHIVGGGLVAGMGFTMSIFIAGLAFRDAPETLMAAKMGVLTGSLVAGVAGYAFLRTVLRKEAE